MRMDQLVREIGFGLAVAVAMTFAALFMASRPVTGHPVLAVFVPGSPVSTMSSAIARAGGSLLEIDQASSWVVTVADDPNLPRKLYAAGAWLVLDGSFAPLCASIGRWSGA